MRRLGIMIAVIAACIIVVVLPILEQIAHARSSDWTLHVDLSKSSFGVSTAFVTLKSPLGYVDRDSVATGIDAKAIFSVPGTAVPEGFSYQVCVSGGLISTLLLPNCKFFRHGSGDEYVWMGVPR
jgi:hypothetical protein